MVKSGSKGRFQVLHFSHAGLLLRLPSDPPATRNRSPSIQSHGLCHGNASQ